MIVKNKKASLPVIVLVILTFVLTSSTLLLFYLNSNKATDKILGVSSIESMYVQENIARYYVYVVSSELKQNESFSKENFIAEFSKFDFEEEYLINLKNNILAGNFSLTGDSFRLNKKSFGVYYVDTKGTIISHVSDLYVDLDNKKEQIYYLNKDNNINDASLGDGTLPA